MIDLYILNNLFLFSNGEKDHRRYFSLQNVDTDTEFLHVNGQQKN
jgi:hypothetical protein